MDSKVSRAVYEAGFLDGAAWAVERIEAGDKTVTILRKALAAQNESVIADADGLNSQLTSSKVVDGLAQDIGVIGGAS